MNNITIYTKKRCAPCTQTKKTFARNHTSFEEIFLEPGTTAAEALIEEGYRATPVIKVYDGDKLIDSWAGFDLEKINQYT